MDATADEAYESTISDGEFVPMDTVARILGWPDEVQVGDRLFEVTDQSVERWLSAMIVPEDRRLLELLGDDPGCAEMARMLLGGEVDRSELIDAYRGLLEGATGRSWWQAEQLTMILLASWHAGVGGRMVLAGAHRPDMPFCCWLDAGMAQLQQVCDKDTMRRITTSINTKPRDGALSDAMDADDFQSAMAAMG